MNKSERARASEQAYMALRNLLPAGSTVYTVLTNVSRSGMSRTIKFLITEEMHGKTNIRDISWFVAQALDYRQPKNKEGVIVSGCGMDMGFHVVSSLASFLGYKDQAEGTNAYGLNTRWL